MAAALQQITQALLDAQQTMSAMRQQFDAELRVMTVSSHDGSKTADEMAAALEEITQALLDVQQTMSAMRRQFDAELPVMNAEVENLRREQLALATRAMDARPMEGERSASSWKGKRGQDKKRKGFDKDDVEAMRIHLWKEGLRQKEGKKVSVGITLYASSEAHARQQGLPGVGEDAREVEGPLEASSEAHARQQGLPRVGEQDAREVGGYDDDEAD
jgi:hypothetical protein